MLKLRKFNFGGVFGGLVCAVAAGVIIYVVSNHDFPVKSIKLIALAGFGGAALGNWIWGLATPPTMDAFDWQTPVRRDDGEMGK